MEGVEETVLDERSPVFLTGEASNTINSISVAPLSSQVLSELLHHR